MDSDKELDIGLKSRTLTNLRRVCGRYGIVPTSYVLAGIVRNEPVPQKTGIVTETWRGIYETKPVAIKIFKITEGRKDYDKIKAVCQIVLAQRTLLFRFCLLTAHLRAFHRDFARKQSSGNDLRTKTSSHY